MYKKNLKSNLRKNNKEKFPSANPQDKLKNKKELLEKVKFNTVVEPKNESDNDSKEVIKLKKQMNKQTEKYESQIRKLQNEIESIGENRKMLNKTLQEKNNEIKNMESYFDTQIEKIKKEHLRTNKDKHQLLEEMANQIEVKDNIIDELKNELSEFKNGNLSEIIFDLKNRLSQAEGQSKHYYDLYNQHKEITKNLRSELDDLKRTMNNKIEFERELLRSRGRELRNEVNLVRKQRFDFFKNLNTKTLFNTLIENLTEDNLFKYHKGIQLLNQKYKNTLEVVQQKEEDERLKRKEERKAWVIDNSEVGYLGTSDEEEWDFYNIDNKVYKVASSKVNNLIPDIPARAFINEEEKTAEVVYCYYDVLDESDEDLETIESKLLRKKSKRKEVDDDYLYFGNFTVLIVGSQNKQRYLWRGQKHGLDMIWHDPFEEHESVLKNKLKRADITIICKRHISHTVSDIVDKNDVKIQYIDRDNEETVMARIRYLAIKLGIIHNADKE